MGKLRKLYIRIFEVIFFIKYTKHIVSLEMSQSRWGFISLFSSFSLFLLGLYVSIYAVWLSWTDGHMTPPFNPNILARGALVALILGIIFVLWSFLFSVYFLLTQNDTIEAKEDRMQKGKIDKILGNTDEIIKKLDVPLYNENIGEINKQIRDNLRQIRENTVKEKTICQSQNHNRL